MEFVISALLVAAVFALGFVFGFRTADHTRYQRLKAYIEQTREKGGWSHHGYGPSSDE